MKSLLSICLSLALLLGAGCSKFVAYTGPEVTRVESQQIDPQHDALAP